MKVPALVAVPPGVVTLHLPVAPPLGTVVLIDVAELTVNVAATEPSLTAVAPVRLVPVSVMFVPAAPLVGAKEETDGAGVGGGPAGAE